jgi:GNAT superfamily N-acetyltransferase
LNSLLDLAPTAELVERDAWLDLFAAAPDHVRAGLGLASTAVAGAGLLGCRAIPITELNRAMAVGVEREPSRDELARMTEWLDANATAWALQLAPMVRSEVIHDYAEDLSLIETGAGWAKFLRIGDASEPIKARAQVSPAEVASADAFGRSVAGGFGLPPLCADWFASLVGRPGWHCFVATVDGETAGGATMYLRGGAAWLGIAGTLPAYRGRGIQRSLLEARVNASTNLGVRLQTSETGQPGDPDEAGFSSFRNQARAGFSRAYVRPNLKRRS